jgi:PKHD-type hydroxylase
MKYIHTSRTGIYIDFGKKIYSGKMYGLTHAGPAWYVFGTPMSTDLHKPTNEGYILKFFLNEKSEMFNEEKIVTGLDNGVHQILLFNGHLYILETAQQRILKVNLSNYEDKQYVYPLEPAISAWYVKEGAKGDYTKYEHMNSITVRNGLFYIMCPFLKNYMDNGNPSQNGNTTSHIKVFDENWRLVDDIDTGRYYCHDLVMVDNNVYFGDATNVICKLSLLTKKVTEVHVLKPHSPTRRIICRGLSISRNGQIYVGSHEVNNDRSSFIVDVNTGKNIMIKDSNNNACCIKCLDGSDYNDETSRDLALEFKELNRSFLYIQSVQCDLDVDSILEVVQTHRLEDARVGEYKNETFYRKTKVTFIHRSEIPSLFEKLYRVICDQNMSVYRFKLFSMPDSVQYAEYSDSAFYEWHMDCGFASSSRKLSITIQLSDPSEYEGGTLEFMISKDIVKAPTEKGSVVIFPSFMLHRVTPVTKGVRKSLVMWIDGPTFT